MRRLVVEKHGDALQRDVAVLLPGILELLVAHHLQLAHQNLQHKVCYHVSYTHSSPYRSRVSGLYDVVDEAAPRRRQRVGKLGVVFGRLQCDVASRTFIALNIT
jgi:hypothetical protein